MEERIILNSRETSDQLGVSNGNIGSNQTNSNSQPSNNLAANSTAQSSNKQNEEPAKLQYTIPGILHFIQHEWTRFEMERSQWQIDRAELQARIAFLQGERKGQENLKNDLVRRIKMLEYALKQERAKYHKLKYGTELNQGEMNPPAFEDPITDLSSTDADQPFSTVSNMTWKQGRQMLRQYLQEIGFTETIIDVRSNRVRQLLGLNNNEECNTGTSGDVNSGSGKRGSDMQGAGKKTPAKKPMQPSTFSEAMMLDAEAAVVSNMEFLRDNNDEVVEIDDDDDDLGDDAGDNDFVENKMKSPFKKKCEEYRLNISDDVDAEAEEVINELINFTQSENDVNQEEGEECNFKPMRFIKNVDRCTAMLSETDTMDTTLGLGELAQLTVNNDSENSFDVSSSKETFRKTWNAKYTLRSHFDGVRALAFDPQEAVLITGSEDHTLKLWNLQKTVPAKKSASLDVEPLYTFRGHTGPVLCLCMAVNGEYCYSAATNGAINCWKLPSSGIDPYDSYESSVLAKSLTGHTDSVWNLVSHSNKHLLSASADGTVKLWSPDGKNPLLQTYSADEEGTPTSVDFSHDDPEKMVVSFTSGHCILFDLERGKQITKFELSHDSVGNEVGHHIYKVVCHPLLPITVTAHEDRHIRFFDNNTGKIVHSMVAHLDAVTCLAIDANGLYLLSGSHDCSIRLWNLDNKTCVQEITAHRKKFDESILDVAFHPSRPFIASAGADGLAKVFI